MRFGQWLISRQIRLFGVCTRISIPLHAVLTHSHAVLRRSLQIAAFRFWRHLHELPHFIIMRNPRPSSRNVLRLTVHTTTLEFARIIDHLAFHNLSRCYMVNCKKHKLRHASLAYRNGLLGITHFNCIMQYILTSHTEWVPSGGSPYHGVDWSPMSLLDEKRMLWLQSLLTDRYYRF